MCVQLISFLEVKVLVQLFETPQFLVPLTRFLCPRNSLSTELQGKLKNTGVGSLSLVQRIFPTQEWNRGLPHCRQILYQLSHQGSPQFAILGSMLKSRDFTLPTKVHRVKLWFFSKDVRPGP